MNWLLLGAFLVYDIVALGVIVKGYKNMRQNFKNEAGRKASMLERVIMFCMAVIIAILWLPLGLLSLAYSKLLR